jgi:hypothetical protein
MMRATIISAATAAAAVASVGALVVAAGLDDVSGSAPVADLAPAERWPEGAGPDGSSLVYVNDFSTVDDASRLDEFVAYRDPFVVTHTTGSSDHASTGGVNCTAPEQTRPQTRDDPSSHVYHCLPMGNAAAGHRMAYAMDTAGYGFAGALPDQVFDGVSEVSVDINTTSAGGRNFVELKVVPANDVFVNAMPCIPDFPCNDGWDYDDIGGVGAGTDSQEGTGLKIATPSRPDGFLFDLFNSVALPNGGRRYAQCSGGGFCFHAYAHDDNTSIRDRYQHVFRDNGDGTLSFGIERDDGGFDWVEAPGSFPDGPARVIVAFHNYTGTKDGNGPGFESNLSPSTGGFTWHWDDLKVRAKTATPSIDYFGGTSSDRIVTPPGCVAFAQGQRTTTNNTDVSPRFHCDGDAPLDL